MTLSRVEASKCLYFTRVGFSTRSLFFLECENDYHPYSIKYFKEFELSLYSCVINISYRVISFALVGLLQPNLGGMVDHYALTLPSKLLRHDHNQATWQALMTLSPVLQDLLNTLILPYRWRWRYHIRCHVISS